MLVPFSLLAFVAVAAAAPGGLGIDSSSVLGAGNTLASGVKDTGLKGVETVKNGVTSGATAAKGFAQSGIDEVKDATSKITSTIQSNLQSDLSKGLIGNMEDLQTALTNSAKSLVGIMTNISDVQGMAKQVADDIYSALESQLSNIVGKDKFKTLVTNALSSSPSTLIGL